MEKPRITQKGLAIIWRLRRTFDRFGICRVEMKDRDWLMDQLKILKDQNDRRE